MSLRAILFFLLVGILVVPIVGPGGLLGIVVGLWMASLVIRS